MGILIHSGFYLKKQIMREVRFHNPTTDLELPFAAPSRAKTAGGLSARPRVLMVGMHLTKTRGGISTLIAEILNSRLREDFDFTYIASQAEDYGRFGKLALAVTSFASFVRAAATRRADVVHVHLGSNASLYREGLFIIAARLFGKRVVGHFHAGDIDEYFPGQPRIGRSFISAALRGCASLVACSRESAKQLAAIAPGPPVAVIPNAIDVAAFEVKRTLRPGPVRILFVGAIGRLKGERDLLAALASMRRDGREFSVSILGYGAGTLAGECRELGISDTVEHLGPVALADRVAFYKEADVFVLPTYAEAMPMSVIEAMAAGLAIVTTRVGGIPEIIEHGVNGLLVEPGDPNELAERIAELCNDPELRLRLGDRAREDAARDLDFENYRERLRDVLTGVIEGEKGK